MDGKAILERLGSSRNILLLQGPVGPFFDHLARFLVEQGRSVSKINLNAGDAWFYRQPAAIDYCEQPDHWPHFVDHVLVERKIDAVVLFGDCRPYHRSAILRARMKSVPVFVFEEGYIRPNFVTFEPGGVNAHSVVPCSEAVFRIVPLQEKVKKRRAPFSRMARYAFMYYLAGRIGRRHYPNYRHHKPFDLYPEGLYWLRSGVRKILYRFTERAIGTRLAGELAGKFFLVPLQVFNDSQIRSHSDFRSVRAMIGTVLDSFAREAPPDVHLVFKHHPMDRGHRHYGRQIAQAATAAGIGERVHYVHDPHLPTLLKNARGAVLVNSTTGVSAMFHGTPVKVLGRCLYDLPGLTHQEDLASFWHNPKGPDPDLYERFRNYLIWMTQVIGSFYSGEDVVLGDERASLRLVRTAPPASEIASAATLGREVRPPAPAMLRTGT